MSFIKTRKPRPLNRDTGALRDDRLFIVGCDDTFAPKQYFNFFTLPRVQVYVVETPEDENTCHAGDVLRRLESIDHEDDDERWMLLDTDHYVSRSHIREFRRIIKEAREKGIFVALSSPCFEFWLLLHHVDLATVSEFADAKSVEKALREQLGGYNKTKLKQEHYPRGSVAKAYFQAEALDKSVKGGVIPASNTSRVYKLWKSIIDNAQPSQLPAELALLRVSAKR